MKLVKVTGTMTIEAFNVEQAQALVTGWDATGDAEVTFDEIGDAPTYETWKVNGVERTAIDNLLASMRGEATTEATAEEVGAPASV